MNNEKNLKIDLSEEEYEEYLFFKKCQEYMDNFVLSRPSKSTTREYKIIKKAVKVLSPLTSSNSLALFLNINKELVIFAIKRGFIEYFKIGDKYTVKTASILPFLKEFPFIIKEFDN